MQADLFATGPQETAQQAAVIESFVTGSGDVAVVARAGTGKTWTIERGIAARPARTSAIMCAFNKDIADELGRRVRDPLAKAKTLHAVGNGAVTREFGRQRPNKNRERDLARQIGVPEAAADDVGRIAQMAKEIAPAEATDPDRLAEIAVDFGLSGEESDQHPLGVRGRAAAAARVVIASHDVAANGEISFSDMLYLPIALNLRPDQFDIVVVDEAQDMNLAHHQLAARMRRAGGRLVVVGDPRQAIYSWRGAAPGALEQFAATLRARVLALSVTFRCGRAIVEQARKIIPDIEAAPGAADGLVREAETAEMLRAARPGDFVLSRTNAPLIRTCIAIRRRGGRAVVTAGDLEGTLVGIVRAVARGQTSMQGFLAALRRWREREHRRATDAGRRGRADQVVDQADTIAEFAAGAATVDAVAANIRSLFVAPDDGPVVVCSTVHKAKGREADRVWILQDTLDAIRPATPAEATEEENIKYVAITRARRELIWTTP